MTVTFEDINERLYSSPLCQGLSVDEFSRLRQLAKVKKFPSGSVWNLSIAYSEIMIIIKGTVKVSVLKSDGSWAILSILGPSDIIDAIWTLPVSDDSFGITVTAIESSIMVVFSVEEFKLFLDHNPIMAKNMMYILSRRLGFANKRIMSLALDDVPIRIARILLSLVDDYGIPASDDRFIIPMRLSQGDLGALVGATRVTVNRALSRMIDIGALTVDNRQQITVSPKFLTSAIASNSAW